MECEYIIKDEIKLDNPIDPIDKTMKVAKGTVKIELSNDKGLASGFFLQLKRNNKNFYCLMTNAHVVNEDMIKNKEKIKIKYDIEEKELNLELNEEERIIINCYEGFGYDISIIEIIPKDEIKDKTYFLEPNTDDYNNFIEKEIQIIQFPEGKRLSLSEAKITGKHKTYDYMFFHEASTKKGSSGSPIVLKNDDRVLGIHKGAIEGKEKNIGIFIGDIVESLKEYKKEGKGKDYYEDGKIKYEGNFEDDEYNDDKGKFYDENGNKYEGKFTKGKKNGEYTDNYGHSDVFESDITHNRTGIYDFLDKTKRKFLDKFRKNILENNKKFLKSSTDILIYTDGFSFSATSGFLKAFQNTGGAIIVGFNGNPKIEGTSEFDASQSSSSVAAFQCEEYFNLQNNGFIVSSITYSESYDDSWRNKSQTPIPREYTVDLVDERVPIYGPYSDDIYDKFIKEAKKIFDNYETKCSKNEPRLLLEDESCHYKRIIHHKRIIHIILIVIIIHIIIIIIIIIIIC